MKNKQTPWNIRKIVKDSADMEDRKFENLKHLYISALPYLPTALLKCLENIPMPWEPFKQVNIFYQNKGALTLINESPRFIPSAFTVLITEQYKELFDTTKNKPTKNDLDFPLFDDEEPVKDYTTIIFNRNQNAHLVNNYIFDLNNIEYLLKNNITNSKNPKKYILDKNTSYNIYKMFLICNKSLTKISLLMENNWEIMRFREAICNAKTLEVKFKEMANYQPLVPLRINKNLYTSISQSSKERKLTNFINKERSLYKFNDYERQIYYKPVTNYMKITYPHIYSSNFPIKYHLNRKCKDWIRDIPLSYPCFGLYKEEIEAKEFTKNGLCKKGLKLLYAKFPFNNLKGHFKRPQEIDCLKWKLADKSMNTFAARQLRKCKFKNSEHKVPAKVNRNRFCKIVQDLKGFDYTCTDWLDASLQLMKQARNILTLLIHQKSVTYMHLDYNFNLKPIKTLTTKERKRSRFGHSFHIVREMCKILKNVIDLHLKYRTGDITINQLTKGLKDLFNNIGEYTGIYRYKYKVMKQIKKCKFIQEILDNCKQLTSMNNDSFKKTIYGDWIHTWRIWVFFFKSICPVLRKWLSGLLKRRLEGRKREKAPFTVTKQRLESQFDISLKKDLKDELFLMIDENNISKKSYLINLILKKFGMAWKSWKNNEVFQDESLISDIRQLINKYVTIKSELYIKECLKHRGSLKDLSSVEKKAKTKYLGRYTRLVLKEEFKRQTEFTENCSSLSQSEQDQLIITFKKYLEKKEFVDKIAFPPLDNPDDNTLLLLTVETLKSVLSNKSKLSEGDRMDLETIDSIIESPKEAVNKIKKTLYSQRVFSDLKVEYNDDFFCIYPVYSASCKEKLADAFLNHYLFLESHKRNLFPKWIKPIDEEPLPISVYKFSKDICSIPGIYRRSINSNKTAIVQTQLKYMFDKCNLTLLNKLLRLIMDPTIADYITARNNVDISFKDINYTNSVGIIKGTYLYNFLECYYGLFTDVLLLGTDTAVEIERNGFSLKNNIVLYYRNGENATMVMQFDEKDLQYHESYQIGEMHNIEELNYRSCWDKSKRMKHTNSNIKATNNIYQLLIRTLPISLFEIDWKSTNISILDSENRQLTFELEGFELRITPFTSSIKDDHIIKVHNKYNIWVFKDDKEDITSKVYLKVNENAVRLLESKIKHVLMSARNSVFTKMVIKWNSNLLSFVSYFREAIPSTPGLLKLLERLENKLQNCIKIGINTKMPSRFPPLVFYVLKELGGLEMISIGSTESQRFHLTSGGQHVFIPNVLNYILPWSKEIQKSQEVWESYFNKKCDLQNSDSFLSPNDLVDEWNFGVPRVATLYRKERKLLLFDKGWRLRNKNNRYVEKRFFSFYWTSNSHDGNLLDLETYKIDIMEAFGTIKEILENTLYPATGFKDWKNLFWEKPNSFEATAKNRKLTQAQLTGLKQIPNRRFILWWSSTINRTEVFMGYKVQLDLMGVYMHGKLTHLKVCYVQMMRSHLWQKIHESIIMDLCQALDKQAILLNIHNVQKQTIHPKKSYKFNASCADIILRFKDYLNNDNEDKIRTEYFWIDLQLKWGDVDNKDTRKSCKQKYRDLTSHPLSVYPGPLGIMVVIDLCYNTWAMYGQIPTQIRGKIEEIMEQIMKLNPALWVLRERVRKALQLHQSEPISAYITPANYGDLFGKKQHWLIDDSLLYRVRIKNTPEGLKTAKVVNGANMIFNPVTGKLYAKIIHKDTWAFQRRTAELSKWKCAEETLGLIIAEKEENRPHILVVNKQALLNPMGLHMIDYPNILIKTSDVKINLKSLELITCFYDDIILGAAESHLRIFNLYDDWLECISPFTAFSRLVLILKAISIELTAVEKILGKINMVASKEGKDLFWPVKSDEEWIKAEIKLKDFIIANFCSKNSIRLSSLKPSDIKDIILDSQNERIKELDELTNMSEKELRETLKNMGNIEKTAADKLFGKSEESYRHDIDLKGKLALEAEFITDSEDEDDMTQASNKEKYDMLYKEGIKKHKAVDLRGNYKL